MSRLDLPPAIAKSRIVVVARKADPAALDLLLETVEDPADLVLEITMDSEQAEADIARLSAAGATVGAGTVLDVAQAETAAAAGAQFLVSPYTDQTVIDWAVQNRIPIAPGALTPTEIAHAWALGAAAVKIFPASVSGTALFRELRGPLGHIPLMPTGGINAENARSYIDVGAIAVGVGSWLTGGDLAGIKTRWNTLREAVGR